MQNSSRRWRAAVYTTALTLMVTAATGLPAHAHHVMGGRTPATFVQGLLSGLGHPIIGIDHLAFIVAMGVAVGAAGLSLAIPGLFIVASAVGVVLHANGVTLPIAELIVAASVLFVGGLIASGRAVGVWSWTVLFCVAGLFHGYAFGESIVGAEPTPLAAYLVGLVIVQAALATGIALIARRSGAGAFKPRLAGAVIAGIGIAVLAGQLVPA
jgi:urease accessory protein